MPSTQLALVSGTSVLQAGPRAELMLMTQEAQLAGDKSQMPRLEFRVNGEHGVKGVMSYSTQRLAL